MTLANGVGLQSCGCAALPNCTLSGWSLLEYVIFCNVSWWIAYYLLILLTKQSEEWCCRVLTLVHGCVVSYSAISDLVATKGALDFQKGPLSDTQINYLSFMLSYFIFDFCWFHFFGNEPWVIYFHHITSILIICKIMLSQYCGTGISYAVAGLEVTNPYLQLRWFLRTHGYLNTPIHTIVELWFFALFSVIRTIGGTILFYYTTFIAPIDLVMKLCFLCIYIVSLVLQWQIISYFRKKYYPGHGRNMIFTHSRVSISQYFQRRTLDRPEGLPSEESGEATPKNTETPMIALQAADTGGSAPARMATLEEVVKSESSPTINILEEVVKSQPSSKRSILEEVVRTEPSKMSTLEEAVKSQPSSKRSILEEVARTEPSKMSTLEEAVKSQPSSKRSTLEEVKSKSSSKKSTAEDALTETNENEPE